jgi:hypothetical protein
VTPSRCCASPQADAGCGRVPLQERRRSAPGWPPAADRGARRRDPSGPAFRATARSYGGGGGHGRVGGGRRGGHRRDGRPGRPVGRGALLGV